MRIRHGYGEGNCIGKRVRELRLCRHLRQCDLSAMLQLRGTDMSTSSLSKLEGQLRPARDREILALCQVLGTTPNDLFG